MKHEIIDTPEELVCRLNQFGEMEIFCSQKSQKAEAPGQQLELF